MAYDARPLLQRLEMFEAIPPRATDALLGILGDVREMAKGESLREEGGPAAEFWLATEGWFFDSVRLTEGGRQVLTIYQSGDVMGLQDLGWDVAVCDTDAATAGRIVRIEKRAFRDVVAEFPVLGSYFLTYGLYDHTRLIDRLRVVGRMEAVRRVAHLLCQVWADQAEPDPMPESGRFRFPLDQQLIGDAVGLTNISVSRMMGELERAGLIERQGREVFVPDAEQLKSFCEFKERRRAVPLSWVLDTREGFVRPQAEPAHGHASRSAAGGQAL